ncbi:MAG: branched-chain amino acid ABC transporter permease [Solirubrobacteraceae bacterium]|nr:MAG: branched-chain amino acid ABC transporter permease [Solirubrobacterales bacterium]
MTAVAHLIARLEAARAGWLRLPRQTLARHLVLAVGFGLAFYVLSVYISPYRDSQLATAAYYFTALVGLTVLTGLNGQLSIGHGALMAIGAYATVLLIGRAHFALVPTLVAVTVITATAGGVLGAGAARLRGPYLAGATLALAVGLPALADGYPGTFGGDNGLTVAPPTPPASLGLSFPLTRWEAWIAGVGALVAFVVVANLLRGRAGRVFRAVRDHEVSAQLVGIPVARTQVLAFTLSAACAGLAGGLYVVVNQLAAPGAFQLSLSLSLLTGVVLGGLGTLGGAVWGALALVFLPAWATNLSHAISLPTNVSSNLPLALYGIALAGGMLLAPRGIQGALGRAGQWLGVRLRKSTSNEEGSDEQDHK